MPKEKNGVRYILAIGIILLLLQFSKRKFGVAFWVSSRYLCLF